LCNKPRTDEKAGNVQFKGENNACRVLWKNLKERTAWKIYAFWENNIKMCLKETGREGVDWILLAHDREYLQAVVSTVMNVQVA
jgi:hypothetical protein